MSAVTSIIPHLLSRGRPANTLLYVGAHGTWRLDLDAVGKALGDPLRLEASCPEPEGLARSVELALTEGPAAGRRLWVLYEGLALTGLGLPVVQTAGIGEEALEQALAFEATALADMPSTDVVLGRVALGEQDGLAQFFVVLAHRPLLQKLTEVAAGARTRLAGLAHPAGLPRPLRDNPGGWQRVEGWDGSVVGLTGTAEGLTSVQVWPLRPNPALAGRELERWLKGLRPGGTTESLSAGETLPYVPNVAADFRMDLDEDRASWMGAWGRELMSAQPPAVPLLTPAPGKQRERLLAGLPAAAALLVCLGHFGWFSHQQTLHARELGSLKAADAQMRAERSAITRLEARRDELQKHFQDTESAAALLELLAALRLRPAILLQAMAMGRSELLVVNALDGKGDEAVIRGASLSATAPNELASALERELHDLGWRVEQPSQKSLDLLAGGGPWEFELKLRDLGWAGFRGEPGAENP